MKFMYVLAAVALGSVPFWTDADPRPASNAEQRLIGQAVTEPGSTGDGLAGRYYRGIFGKLLRERVDPGLNFYWDFDQRPMRGVPATNFSVKWTGFLKAPQNGRHELILDADDGVRLWVNGKLLVDEWRGQPASRFTTAVELEKDRYYAIEVEYFQANFDATAKFSWRVNEGPEYIVPQAYLYSALPVDTENFFAGSNPAAYSGKQVARAEGVERLGAFTGTGLKAAYFDGREFERPVAERVDATIDNYWDREEAAPGTGVENFSATWDGFVRAPESGNYRFSCWMDDGARVSVGGQELISSWVSQLPNAYSGWIYLEKDRFYPIHIDYYQHDWDATARLKWSYEGFREAVVPMEHLFPELPEEQPELLAREETDSLDVPVDLADANTLEPEPLTEAEPEDALFARGDDAGEETVEPWTDEEPTAVASVPMLEEEGRGATVGASEEDVRGKGTDPFFGGDSRPEVPMLVYPNPSADGQFNLQLEVLSERINVYVFDLKGQRVYSEVNISVSPGTVNVPVDLQGKPAGTYLIRVQTDDGIWDGKAVLR